MTELSNALGSDVYKEDVPVVVPGFELIGGPCTVWDITVTMEDSAVAVVNFSDSADAYANAKRCEKVVISGPTTQHLIYPKGMTCTEGLCVIANNGSVDVRVSYD